MDVILQYFTKHIAVFEVRAILSVTEIIEPKESNVWHCMNDDDILRDD